MVQQNNPGGLQHRYHTWQPILASWIPAVLEGLWQGGRIFSCWPLRALDHRSRGFSGPLLAHHQAEQPLDHGVSSGITPTGASLSSPAMDSELWKGFKAIAISLSLLVIARAAYRKTQTTGRPPVVSYIVPWVGSAIELGKSPDAFFERAMCVKQFFARGGWRLTPRFQCQIRGDLHSQGFRADHQLCHFAAGEETRD